LKTGLIGNLLIKVEEEAAKEEEPAALETGLIEHLVQKVEEEAAKEEEPKQVEVT